MGMFPAFPYINVDLIPAQGDSLWAILAVIGTIAAAIVPVFFWFFEHKARKKAEEDLTTERGKSDRREHEKHARTVSLWSQMTDKFVSYSANGVPVGGPVTRVAVLKNFGSAPIFASHIYSRTEHEAVYTGADAGPELLTPGEDDTQWTRMEAVSEYLVAAFRDVSGNEWVLTGLGELLTNEAKAPHLKVGTRFIIADEDEPTEPAA